MKTFKVEIMPCGTKAKTLNPVSRLCPIVLSVAIPFNFFKREEAILARKKWQQAERECKVYDIDYSSITIEQEIRFNYEAAWIYDENTGQCIFKPGSIHEATEINTKQIRIL